MGATSRTQRVALAGLSANPTGFAWVNNVHLPYLKARSDVEIVAVIGRTLASAQAAIAKNSLPSSVKAYGSAEDAAKAGHIDLVVVGVPSLAHRDIIMPFLETKTNLFVEWPIDINHRKSKELVDIAHGKVAKTAVDMQGRFSLVAIRLSEIVSSGRIGKVLSVSVFGGVPTGGRHPEQHGVRYSLSKDSGATIVDIYLAHLLECLIPVVGRLKSVVSNLGTMRQTTHLVNKATGEIVERDVAKTAPDQISVSGKLESGAFVSINIHGGPSPSGSRILIMGDEGEIELSAPLLIPWINAPFPWVFKIQDGSGTTEEVVQESTQQVQVAVHELWDAFFDDKGVTSFEEAIRTQEVIEAVWRSDREGRRIEL
ncbi:hypothetical protein BGZ63DRAFT_494817 [Mariannaea sp. PMI_226]|nr:hypothetical protein BGZ63DRAFT_494817 [Mariannaea sp. PMI_226]